MPSPKSAWWWLLEKEWRELVVSRAWWMFLLAMGPLVGVSFISSVRSYAEVSGLGGTAAGIGEALSPLVGIWAPTFSACELAAVFLLPFVCIRLVACDRQSGALQLELQHRISAFTRVTAKAMVLFGAWIVASLAPVAAIVLWKTYGGSVYAPELVAVVIGHVLNAGLTIALAAAAASITEHPSTAAIVTLSLTVGTWMISFVAAVQGGIWERIARYTPTAIVGEFQRGLLRMDRVLIVLILMVSGLALSAIWIRLGVAFRRRVGESLALGAIMLAAATACSRLNATWDVSENRMNSFPEGDERTLRQIQGQLRIEAHLAPEDPRRFDFDRRALSKLLLVMPSMKVEYKSATSIGLFEQTSAHYGEIWYELDGKKAMSRLTTADGVLETIYALAGLAIPAENGQSAFRGHPLAVPPKGAALVFYGIWPAVVIASGTFMRRRNP